MSARTTTPPSGSLAVALWESFGPPITVRAKSHQALMSATAKTVAAIQSDHRLSEPVLVVYGDDAAQEYATVFCEQAAPSVKPGLQR